MSNLPTETEEEIEVAKSDAEEDENVDINNELHDSPLLRVPLNGAENPQTQGNGTNNRYGVDPVGNGLRTLSSSEEERILQATSEFNDIESGKSKKLYSKECSKVKKVPGYISVQASSVPPADFQLNLQADTCVRFANEEVEDINVRIVRSVYHEDGSLDAVPLFACPFNTCRRKYNAVPSFKMIAQNGVIHFTIAGISKLCIANQSHDIRFPSMKSAAEREKAFRNNKTFERLNWPDVSELVSAGFFSDGKIIKCFDCTLEFRLMDKRCDPLREHARWNPCCHFLRSRENGELFIHKVLEETIDILNAHEVLKSQIKAHVASVATSRMQFFKM